MGRLGGTWCDPDNTQLLSPPTPPRRFPPFSSFPPFTPPPLNRHLQWSLPLWRTALRASPITQCSGRAAGVTAHMSQHDRGVSCHACPLTFPTLRVHAESERRGKKAPLLPPWLPKCYHMVRSLPLSLTVPLSLSPSLSRPVTEAVFDCSPDKRELYDLSPGLAVPSPGLILKPNSSPLHPLAPPLSLLLQLQGKAVFWQEMNSSQMSAGT